LSHPKSPLQYIPRTREWYQGLGYGAPYQWAQFEDVPFTVPGKPLSESVVGLVTTAALYQENSGDQGPGASYNAQAKFYSVYSHPIDPDPDVRISHIAYDRKHTSAKDKNTWFPLTALKKLEKERVIDQVAKHFFGLPTNRSQRHTLEHDCPTLHQQLSDIDLAILIANCPVCHQSVSLAARYLEEQRIPTVIMGCAKDIVENVGVPRFLFCDFPLGNAAGKPFDLESQNRTISMAVNLFESANSPRYTVQSAIEWHPSHDWKNDYSNIALLSDEEIARRRSEFDRQKTVAKQRRRNQS